MKRQVILTADGSKTIFLPEWNEHYHSKHGAIQEALHVFIKHGLHYTLACHSELDSESKKRISILEIGFGTGLNAFLTALEASKLNLEIDYTGVEAYPVKQEEIKSLNYAESQEEKILFQNLHEAEWAKPSEISSQFTLEKQELFFHQIEAENTFDLIYFDAFGARVQPELWTETIFEIMFKALKSKGILVTYAAKGSVRRAMQAVGFSVKKLPGPPGKREMLRALKGA
ncbi:MAG TPA: tRNA (5-methylaminomethyl-2-thiouridine)(34)-methyltransferase MnmD [Flavobacteriaceae bacterium]|nr:tRNA (5-methylaminomethyl-2-thiouridine)(34)-methyltransferase MnmD [Flavobacteriaceae bacterium]